MEEKNMSAETNKAILVVSFGTSYEETRKLTIEAIEATIAQAFPDHKIYRAWTSKMILAKLKKRDHIHIDNVREAMEKMWQEGITDVVIQPTHVINGIENDLMKKDALAFQDKFHSICFGDPLLTTEEDNRQVIEAIGREFGHIPNSQAVVLMGHGTTHHANTTYAALDYTMKDMGYSNFFLGTVEAYPSMDTLMKMIRKFQPEKVHLAPFMIVAGEHAKNDLAGESPESWCSQFRDAGFHVEPYLKGLGEYAGIRDIFVRHVQKVPETDQPAPSYATQR